MIGGHLPTTTMTRHEFDSEERDLGLDARITRRDFLDASLLAAGSVLLRRPAPLRQAPVTNPEWEGFGGVGDYAR